MKELAAATTKFEDDLSTAAQKHEQEIAAAKGLCKDHVATITDLKAKIAAQKEKSPSKATLEMYHNVFIRDYQASPDFRAVLDKNKLEGHTQGRYEILRHAAAAGIKTDVLKKWYSTTGCTRSLRDYHHLFPFSLGDCID